MEETETAFALHDSTSIDADQATDVEEKPTELDDKEDEKETLSMVHDMAADMVAAEVCS